MYFMGSMVYFIEDTWRHSLNEDTLFMYFWRYVCHEGSKWLDPKCKKKIGFLRNVSFNWQKITWSKMNWYKLFLGLKFILSFINNNNNNTIDMQMKLNYNFSANAQFLLHTRTPKNS